MSFVVYLAVVLVAVASALFGLDLLTAPLPPKPPVQVASTSAPNKISQRETQQKQQADKKVTNRAPSPMVPVNPRDSKDVGLVHQPAVETTGASRADAGGASVVLQQPQAQPKQLPQSIQPVTTQTAAVAPEQTAAPNDKTDSLSATAPAPATEPVAQQAAGRCNVQACSGAYSSFRESDCTYQPISGPRRLCGKSGAQKRATASARPRVPYARAERETRNWDARRNPEVDDAVRGVRRMPYFGRYDEPDLAGPVGGRRTSVNDRRGLWP